MNIVIIKEKISRHELKKIAKDGYGDMIKIVVDINQEIIALGAELHSDEEETLIAAGSKRECLWGANFYLNQPAEKQIEYISLINIKSNQNNRSMEIQDQNTRNKVRQIVKKLLI